MRTNKRLTSDDLMLAQVRRRLELKEQLAPKDDSIWVVIWGIIALNAWVAVWWVW